MYSCRKPYTPHIAENVNTILVVEGTIASGTGVENRFLLSRLRPLQDTTINDPEQGARVNIESRGGQRWALAEQVPGTYSATLSLPQNSTYKLTIVTQNGRQYETGFLAVTSTPAVDSVTWSQPDDLEIFVHTHDPANSTKYYRWEFTETWEYHSVFDTNMTFENGQIVFHSPADQTYACWSSSASGSIIINNTTALSEDRISYQPIQKLLRPSDKVSYKYSILVRQYGLPEEAYKFWNILRKNTELTGTLFDPQPSQLPGNIVCKTDSAEMVIGFVSAGIVSEKRIYIKNSELVDWQTASDSSCLAVTPETNNEALAILASDTTYGPAYNYPKPPPIGPVFLAIAKKPCIDCRRKGGTTTKPPYWQ
jgi:hypothetical protein